MDSSDLIKFYNWLSERAIIEDTCRGEGEAEAAVKLYNKRIESCNNCKFDSECRHKSMMPKNQTKCKFYIKAAV